MLAELFALLSAVSFAVNNILMRKGLKLSNTLSAFFLTILIDNAVFWSLLFAPAAFNLPITFSISQDAIILFVITGAITPGIAYLLRYISIDKVGVSIASPVISTTPFFALIGAIMFLGESLTLLVFAATVSLVLGVILLSWERGKIGRWKDMIYPILTAVLYGAAAITRKMGMNLANFAILAASIGAVASLILYMPYLALVRKKLSLNRKNGLMFLLFGALFGTIARIFIFYSYSLGEVIRIEPLMNSSPAFTLALASVFLKKEERITLKIVTGASLVILGVILIVFS
jgi:uncharacterized membrane protein